MRIFAILPLVLLVVLLGTAAAPAHAQGALEPSAPPGPVMKTLDQVEPRTPLGAPGTISAPGSYYLTGNITGTLTIAANDVELDLRGYTVTGSSLNALEIASATNVRVHNGTFREATSVPVRVLDSSNVSLENLRILNAFSDGIRVEGHSGLLVVRSVLVDTAGFAGIRVANTGDLSMEAVIEDNIVRNANTITNNLRQGISVFHTGTGDLTVSIKGNRVFNNRTLGITVSVEGSGAGQGVISGNSVYGNGSTGMIVNGDFVVTKNIAHANGTNYSLSSAPNAAPVSSLANAGPWDNVEQ